MKSVTFNKKLTLKRNTIINLDLPAMQEAKGGLLYTLPNNPCYTAPVTLCPANTCSYECDTFLTC